MTSPLVVVKTYHRLLDAQIARGRLQAAGIAAFLPDEQVASIDPLLQGALGGLRLQVRKPDAERAAELLEDPPEEPDDELPEGETVCPRCDSPYWGMKWSGAQALAGVLLLGVPFGRMRKQARCDRCEHVWDEAARTASCGAPYRSATPTPRRAGRPVFRLRRTRALAGVFWGLATALLGIFVGGYTGLVALIAPLVGFLLGRRSGEDLCSDPSCRARLGVRRTICPGCHGSVEGSVASAQEHYIAKAAWHRAGVAALLPAARHPTLAAGAPLDEPRAQAVRCEAPRGGGDSLS